MSVEGAIRVDLPGGAGAELYDPAGAARPKRWRRFAERADAARVLPPVLELHDVILCHGRERACLYDSEGVRIDASALPRYDMEGQISYWNAAPTMPSPGAPLTIEAPVVYGSIFFQHWGHFLLESLARIGVARADPELSHLPNVFSWTPAPEYRLPSTAAILDVIGAPLIESGEPNRVRLRQCFVPPPAFGHYGFADPLHRALPLEIARRLSSGAGEAARPAYFSRTRVASAVAIHAAPLNEPELERRLAARGVEIVHMQDLPLAEQIRVVDKRRALIGLWGSAFHNILFAQDGAALSTFVLIEPRQLPCNFMLVDSIVGNHAHYLATLGADGEGAVRIDIEATLAYLEAVGVFQ